MKITFPHLGHLHIPLRAMLESLDLEVVPPPPTTRRTLDIGVQHSPEFICLPYKLMLGNLVEAAEAGADTALMVEGPGLCRLGYYGEIQQVVLGELGLPCVIRPIDVSDNALAGLLGTVKRLSGKPWRSVVRAFWFGLSKLRMIESLDRLALWSRPRVTSPGSVDAVVERAMAELDSVQSVAGLREAGRRWSHELRAASRDAQRPVLKIGLIGEFFVVLDEFSNQRVEGMLGRNGVEVVKFLYVSDWLNFHFFLKLLRIIPEQHSIVEAARPYVGYDISGDGQKSLGQTVISARRGFDGIVHLMPFSCMPEIVARYQLPRASADHDIPVLSVTVDEKLATAGLETRIEAFVDLLRLRSERRPV